MTLELDKAELELLGDVLRNYISNLREEIVKTEKHEWREALHRQEAMLNALLDRMAG